MRPPLSLQCVHRTEALLAPRLYVIKHHDCKTCLHQNIYTESQFKLISFNFSLVPLGEFSHRQSKLISFILLPPIHQEKEQQHPPRTPLPRKPPIEISRNKMSSTTTTAKKAIAIIAGVGPGTGAAVSRRFAQSYPVVLLARNPTNYQPYVEEINSAGGKAMGIATDLSSAESVSKAFREIEAEFGGGEGSQSKVTVAAAVYNASGRFVRKPFLELGVEEFMEGWDVSV